MAQPEKRFMRGTCSASIFVNEVQKNGQDFRIKKAVFQKRYKDAKGDWQTTSSLDINEIPKAIRALEAAYDYLISNAGEDGERQG